MPQPITQRLRGEKQGNVIHGRLSRPAAEEAGDPDVYGATAIKSGTVGEGARGPRWSPRRQNCSGSAESARIASLGGALAPHLQLKENSLLERPWCRVTSVRQFIESCPLCRVTAGRARLGDYIHTAGAPHS